MATHTDGPWETDLLEQSCRIDVWSRSGSVIAGVECGDGYIPSERGIANARLIAAAPDMLAALEYLAEHASHEVGVPLDQCTAGPIGAARAAIAKARGK